MKISIITVCRNDKKGLENTFESIRSQDCDAFEWWVIDGNSTDGTVEWLKENHTFDGGWESEPDNGIYDAMNKGIGLAKGDYLLFLNSGDLLADPEVISKLIQEIEKAQTVPDFLYGDALDVNDDGRSYYRKARSLAHIKIGMLTRHQAMLYRREHVFHERYPLNFKLSADYALTANLLMKDNFKILQMNFPVCQFSSGGCHETQRLKALREDYEIRRKVLKLNVVTSLILFSVHWLHYYLRKSFPALNKTFIYIPSP